MKPAQPRCYQLGFGMTLSLLGMLLEHLYKKIGGWLLGVLNNSLILPQKGLIGSCLSSQQGSLRSNLPFSASGLHVAWLRHVFILPDRCFEIQNLCEV